MSLLIFRALWGRDFARWLRCLSDDEIWSALRLLEREGIRRGWHDFWTED